MEEESSLIFTTKPYIAHIFQFINAWKLPDYKSIIASHYKSKFLIRSLYIETFLKMFRSKHT